MDVEIGRAIIAIEMDDIYADCTVVHFTTASKAVVEEARRKVQHRYSVYAYVADAIRVEGKVYVHLHSYPACRQLI